MLRSYRETLDILLDQVDYDLFDHTENDIQEFHDKIIYASQQAQS